MTSRAVGLTKTQAAYASIRHDIEVGEFLPATRLRINALQTRLGISPTPVREALRMLQADGFVTNHPHQGMTVTSHDPEDVEEVYQLREILEPLAAQLAARNRTEDVAKRLTELHEATTQAVHDGHDTLAAELNSELHSAIAEASGSYLLADFCARLRIILPMTGLWLTSRANLSILEHETIVTAIAKGDAAAAAAAMRYHIDRGHHQAVKRFSVKAKTSKS